MRPDFDPYILSLAKTVATRGTCSRRQVGAVLVREGHPRETGYNGAPSGERHCAHEDYARPEDDPDLAFINGDWRCIRADHAEANVIRFAKLHWTPLDGSSVYVTCRPCVACTGVLIAARVGEIVTWAGQDTAVLEEALRGTETRLRLV